MTKIPSVEERVEGFMSQYAWGTFFTIELEQEVRENLLKTLTAEREAMRKETMRTVMAQCRKLVDEPEEAIYLEEIEEMLYELDQEYLTPPTK